MRITNVLTRLSQTSSHPFFQSVTSTTLVTSQPIFRSRTVHDKIIPEWRHRKSELSICPGSAKVQNLVHQRREIEKCRRSSALASLRIQRSRNLEASTLDFLRTNIYRLMTGVGFKVVGRRIVVVRSDFPLSIELFASRRGTQAIKS